MLTGQGFGKIDPDCRPAPLHAGAAMPVCHLYLLLLLCLGLVAGPAAAAVDAWPAVHDVSGVAADDVLNIRAEPTASAPIVGTFAPDATGIEVVRTTEDGRWGLVNIGEGTGWVSMAFLARGPGQYDGASYPITSCFGTEPFWTLAIGSDWVMTTPEGVTFRSPAAPLTGSIFRRARHGALSMTSDGRPVALLTTAERCTDGMSDREFGLSASLMIGTGDEMQFHAGCCTLAR